jgi:hypothetical protein
MVHLTLKDHTQIHRIVRLINTEKKLRNKTNFLLQLLHRVLVRRIKKIDENYFHPRIIEAATHEQTDYLRIGKLNESHYKYFTLFKEILHGNFKNRSDI